MLELIVVLVVIALIATIALPTFQRVIGKSEDSQALSTLQAIGRDAGALAASANGPITPDIIATAAAETRADATVGTNAGAGQWAAAVDAGSGAASVTTTAPRTVAWAIDSAAVGLSALSDSGAVVNVRINHRGMILGTATTATGVADGTQALTGTPSPTTTAPATTTTTLAAAPPAPTATGTTPGSQSLAVAFSGGAALNRATCVPSGGGAALTGTSAASPITVAGLTNGTTYNCTVASQNSGTAWSTESGIVTGTPLGAQTAAYAHDGTENFGDGIINWLGRDRNLANPFVNPHNRWFTTTPANWGNATDQSLVNNSVRSSASCTSGAPCTDTWNFGPAVSITPNAIKFRLENVGVNAAPFQIDGFNGTAWSRIDGARSTTTCTSNCTWRWATTGGPYTQIRIQYAANGGSWTGIDEFEVYGSVTYDPAYLAAPAGLAGTPDKVAKTVALTWNAVPNAISYRVYKAGVLVASPTSPSANISGVTEPTASFQVATVSATGIEGQKSTAIAVEMTEYPQANLAAHLDASVPGSMTLSGSDVVTWSSTDGPAISVTNATAAERPVYSATSFAGRPGITFTNDTLTGPDAVTAGVNSTWFIVTDTGGVGQGIDGFGAGWGHALTAGSYSAVLTSGGAVGYTATAPANANVQKVVAGRTTQGSNVQAWTNGAASAPTAFTKTTTRTSTIGLTIGRTHHATMWRNGTVAEILVYSRGLSDAEIATVTSYLRTKWGI